MQIEEEDLGDVTEQVPVAIDIVIKQDEYTRKIRAVFEIEHANLEGDLEDVLTGLLLNTRVNNIHYYTDQIVETEN